MTIPPPPVRPPIDILFTHGGGRFANQLMVFAHLIGIAREFPHLRVVNYSFWPYADLCAGTEHNRRCAYPPAARAGFWVRTSGALRAAVWRRRRVAAHRILGLALYKIFPGRAVDVGDDAPVDAAELLRRIGDRRRVLLHGWKLRDWDLVAKHQDAVRAFLAPAGRFRRPADEFVTQVRQRYDTLIGLLIRQDDYRVWGNGRFFITSEGYRPLITQLRDRFGPRAGILIATDEAQAPDAFADLDVTWCTGEKAGPGHYLESFAELALCDVIASVPSTFAAWAAFLGNKPLLPIAGPGADLRSVPLIAGHLLEARMHPVFGVAIA